MGQGKSAAAQILPSSKSLRIQINVLKCFTVENFNTQNDPIIINHQAQDTNHYNSVLSEVPNITSFVSWPFLQSMHNESKDESTNDLCCLKVFVQSQSNPLRQVLMIAEPKQERNYKTHLNGTTVPNLVAKENHCKD